MIKNEHKHAVVEKDKLLVYLAAVPTSFEIRAIVEKDKLLTYLAAEPTRMFFVLFFLRELKNLQRMNFAKNEPFAKTNFLYI